MIILLTLATILFVAWLHAVIIRLQKKDSAYNKYVLGTALFLYLTCNIIQSQTFEYKMYFSLLFILYSLFAIPFHIWLMVSWTKTKKNPSH